MKLKNIRGLLSYILLCELAGVIGAFFTAPSIDGWYDLLNKPTFNPPNWIFGPTWLVLYALMGVSIYLVIKYGWKSRLGKFSTLLFFIHLFLNAIWSPIFFGAHQILASLVVIIAIWVMIIALFFLFKKISRLSAYLLIPYFLWVSFASLLNYSILLLN